MRALKWIFGTVLVLFLLLLAGAWIYAQSYLEPRLKKEIETRGTQALGAPVTVNSVHVGLIPPFRVTLLKLAFSLPSPKTDVTIETVAVTARVGMDILKEGTPLGRFEVSVLGPRIKAVIPATPVQPTPTPAPTGEQASPAQMIKEARDLTLALDIKNAEVDVSFEGQPRSVRIAPLNAHFDLPSLREAWTVKLKSDNQIDWDGIKAQIPVAFESLFTYDGLSVNTSKTTGDIGGLSFNAKGAHKMEPASDQWDLQVHVPELGELKVPPSLLPPGKFTGQVMAAIRAVRPPQGEWAASVNANIKKFRGETEASFQEAGLKGVVTLDLDTQAAYNKTFNISKLDLTANLDQAAVHYAKLLSKPAGIPLNLRILASGTAESIELKESLLNFARLQARAQGTIAAAAGANSNIHLEIARTDLSGWEKYIPALAQAPVTGFVELKADLNGDLRAPERMNVALAPLLLQDVRGTVKWTAPDQSKSVNGPAELDARATIKARGQDLLDANISAKAELSNLAILMKGTFEKRAGVPLRVDLKAEKKGNQIDLKPSSVDLGGSRFNLSGRVQEPQRPKLQLSLQAPKIQFAEMVSMLPAMKAAVPAGFTGQGSVKAQLAGIYDFKLGIERSPLNLNADFQASIPKYAHKSATPAAGAHEPSAGGPATKPEPLLPSWPIARTAKIKTDISIGQVMFNDLPIQGVRTQSLLNSGVFTGSASVGKVFGGSVQITSFGLDLKLAQPDVNAKGKLSSIDTNAALSWLSKDYKDLVKGIVSGQFSAIVPHPSRPDLVARTRAVGDFKLANAFISTLQFDQMANDVLSKIPGIGEDKRLNSKGVAADVKLDFAFAKNLLTIKDFVFLTPEKNEIQAKGTVDLKTNLNLSGMAYLATAPVKGSIREANSDAQGRFVIPIQIRGSAMRPQASFAQKSIEMVLKKTADLELNKAKTKLNAKITEEKKKLETKAKTKVKGEIDKLGDKIKKDGLKGLFK